MSMPYPALRTSLLLSVLVLAGIAGSASWVVGCAASDDPVESDNADDSADDDTGAADDPTGDGGVNFEVEFIGEGVPCGEERCRDAQIAEFGIGAKGCCVEETSSCGLEMSALGPLVGLTDAGCEQLNAPGSADSACPASEPIYLLIAEAPGEGTQLPGCCRENGSCGFRADFGNVGFGCVDPEEFAQQSSGSCDYEP